jgi:hypothetical protein
MEVVGWRLGVVDRVREGGRHLCWWYELGRLIVLVMGLLGMYRTEGTAMEVLAIDELVLRIY